MTGSLPRFSDIIGHVRTIACLRAIAIQQRFASAYLFYGDDAIGKRTVAEAWSRLIQCAAPTGEPPTLDACGICPSCRLHAAGTHPDVLHLEPETSMITIDQVRAVQASLPFSPLSSSRRVVVLPDANALNVEAANALLKTLEEPPNHTFFILVTAQRDRLLPTILSRCQTVRFAPPSQTVSLRYLTDRFGLSFEQGRALFIDAHGRIGPAIEAASAPRDASSQPERLVWDTIASPSVMSHPDRLLDLAEGVAKDPRALKTLLVWIGVWLRDVLAWKCRRDPSAVLHPDRQPDLDWWADRLAMDDIFDLASGLHRVWAALHRNLNPQLVAEVFLLQISLRCAAARRGVNRS